MAHVITQPCCNDASCVPVCPVDCIHPTPDEAGYASAEMLYIDPEVCIDCGACVDVCPVDAIVPDDELTERNARFAEVNALYYAGRPYPQRSADSPSAELRVDDSLSPLRVAIVGSGPAACYAAEELLSRRGLDVEVDMFERLPTPWGLVRFGVAPDHPETKSVANLFEQTAMRPGFNIHLNVDVGNDVTHDELLEHHHAVIYAVGAHDDRRLDIRGEDLPGSHSATDFVGWYNGHPDYSHLSFDLSAKRAVVVGNGNVALDVARVLVSDIDDISRTDIAEHALEALAESRISEVIVLGRRGPAQAAYTTPELVDLGQVSGADVVADPVEAELDEVTRGVLDENPDPAVQLKADLVKEFPSAHSEARAKRIVLRYFASPVEILGTERVQGLRVVRNEPERLEDGRVAARPTMFTEDLDCGLLLRAVGHRGTPIQGLPFDSQRAIIPNDQGRVIEPASGKSLTGTYTAGWIKRGPSGAIGSNKKCAEQTVRALLDDHAAGLLGEPTGDSESLQELLLHRQPEAVDYEGWQAIDRHEHALATNLDRPRTKLVDIREMLQVVQEQRTPR